MEVSVWSGPWGALEGPCGRHQGLSSASEDPGGPVAALRPCTSVPVTLKFKLNR